LSTSFFEVFRNVFENHISTANSSFFARRFSDSSASLTLPAQNVNTLFQKKLIFFVNSLPSGFSVIHNGQINIKI